MPTRRTKLENATEPNSIKSKRDGAPELVECTQFLPQRTSGSKNSPTLFLSLSLSLTHTHTHNLQEFILIELVQCLFCLLQKPLFFFTYYGSLSEKQENKLGSWLFLLSDKRK
jgi:hypothetical protein